MKLTALIIATLAGIVLLCSCGYPDNHHDKAKDDGADSQGGGVTP